MKLKHITEATYGEHPAIEFILQTPLVNIEEITDRIIHFPAKEVGTVVEIVANTFGQPYTADREYPKRSNNPHGKYWLWDINDHENGTQRVIRITKLYGKPQARLETEYYRI